MCITFVVGEMTGLGDSCCSECSKIFMHKSSLIRHEKRKHKIIRVRKQGLKHSPPFLCEPCDREYCSYSGLVRHHKICETKRLRLSKEKAKKTRIWACEHCLQRFTRKSNLKRHLVQACQIAPSPKQPPSAPADPNLFVPNMTLDDLLDSTI